jgi:hypothetical protein
MTPMMINVVAMSDGVRNTVSAYPARSRPPMPPGIVAITR